MIIIYFRPTMSIFKWNTCTMLWWDLQLYWKYHFLYEIHKHIILMTFYFETCLCSIWFCRQCFRPFSFNGTVPNWFCCKDHIYCVMKLFQLNSTEFFSLWNKTSRCSILWCNQNLQNIIWQWNGWILFELCNLWLDNF